MAELPGHPPPKCLSANKDGRVIGTFGFSRDVTQNGGCVRR